MQLVNSNEKIAQKKFDLIIKKNW